MLSRLFQNRIFQHSIFWVAVVIFSSVTFFHSDFIRSNELYAKLIWVNLFFEYLPTYFFFTYSLLLLVVPLLLKKRYIVSGLAFAVVEISSVFVQKLLSEIDINIIQPLVFGFSSTLSFSFSGLWEDLQNFSDWITLSFDYILIGFVAVGIKFVRAVIRKQAETQRLKIENLQTELKLIKAQINSTFLFNTLDNLYCLTLKKSKESPEIVLRLANLMSYMLYESEVEEVSLDREIEMIQNYVFLVQTNANSKTDIALNISGDSRGKLIAPLVLFPFLENAFVQNERIDQSWVSIQLIVQGNRLKLNIGKGIRSFEDNIFLDVEKRLQYLYNGRYELKTITEEEILFTKLELELNEHAIAKPIYEDEITLLDSR